MMYLLTYVFASASIVIGVVVGIQTVAYVRSAFMGNRPGGPSSAPVEGTPHNGQRIAEEV